MADAIQRRYYARPLRFEPLESRRVLSITVDTLVSENNGVGQGAGTSLQEAILAAAPGDTIDFSVTGTIKLTMAVPVINKNLTIHGPGANLLTIDANDHTPSTKNGDGGRVFTIRDNNMQHLLDVSISGLTLTGGDTGSASPGGGAISSYENLVVSDCVIVGNGSGTGGAVQYAGGAIQSIPEGERFGLLSSLTVRNSILSGNTSLQGEGGAIRKRYGTLLIEDCTITGNSAYWDGGGVSASDSVTVQINRSIISNNRTTYPSSPNYGIGGGAFVLGGTLSISNSTVSGNTATKGGGLGAARQAYLTVTNSTISGNSAATGGAIYGYGTQITNSTLSGNTATSGGGAIVATYVTMSSSTVTANTSPTAAPGAIRTVGLGSSGRISLSIIAGNTNGDVLSGLTSLGYNLIGTGTGTGPFNKTGDQTGVTNPMLGPLADNGGPTKTHVPLPGSPALDTGNPAFNPANPDGNANTNDAMPFDERGAPFVRVYDGDGTGGARIDKGAVERQPVSAVVMGDYNQDAIVDGADYLVWQKSRGTTGLTPYTGADGTGDGAVDQADYALWRFHFGSTVPAAGAGSGASAEEANETLAEPGAPGAGQDSGSLRIADFRLRIDDGHESRVESLEPEVVLNVSNLDDAVLVLLASVRRSGDIAATGAPAGSSDSNSSEAVQSAIEELTSGPLVAHSLGAALASECAVASDP